MEKQLKTRNRKSKGSGFNGETDSSPAGTVRLHGHAQERHQSRRQTPRDVIEPAASARAAGLRYVSDATPGIRRLRTGKNFRYMGLNGSPVRDPETLQWIKSLAIPPAWKEVWICPAPSGHLQATGRDARGRKQYRYHPRWRKVRDETKYDRLAAFGRALPQIRKRVERDLRAPDLPRKKVLATVVRLLETTLIRVGNDEYARQNHSFGLTTMRDRHVQVNGSTVRFEFHGKGRIRHAIDLRDRRLARIVRRCQDLPGEELFQYVDARGGRHAIGSEDVNDYLREITRQDFTAKDFRTWAGTVLAAQALQAFKASHSKAQAKKNIVQAIESVAKRLGNTKPICRKCYVHPDLISAYLDGTLLRTLRRRVDGDTNQSAGEFSPEETGLLAFLQALKNKEIGGSNNQHDLSR